jgi:hypothetical protein
MASACAVNDAQTQNTHTRLGWKRPPVIGYVMMTKKNGHVRSNLGT